MLFNGDMWGLLVLAAGFAIAWAFSNIKVDTSTSTASSKPHSVSVSVTTDESDYQYSIKGINFCGIDDSMLGDFIGTARALKSNPHDPYAIGIYRGSKRVGFLPKGNQELHAKIMAVGGSVDADGYIAKDKEDGRTFYYGKVNLLGI